MRHGLGAHQSAKLTTSTKVDPRIVLSSQVLQFSQPDLLQAIERELDENPALERIDEPDAPVTDEEVLRAVAPAELKRHSPDYEGARSLPTEQQVDWVDLTPSNDSLWDHLRAQIYPQTDPGLRTLVDYLVGSVNDRGYLTCTVEDAALDCKVSLEDSQKVLKLLQSCEPAGVGATSVRECLLLQLRDAQTESDRMARFMVKNCWDELVARNAQAIQRKFKADPDLIEAGFDAILALNPFPGEGYAIHNHQGSRDKTSPALPDLQFTLDEAGWLIEVQGPSPLSLRVSRAYLRRQGQLDDMRRPPRDEKRHVDEFVGRAKLFKEALEQRAQLLADMGRYLVTKQGGFISTGDYQFLKPLTRTQLARDLEVHESTISRATNGKFCQLPNGEIVSFEVFFKPALRVQKMIEDILNYENPSNPLSDERIREMLAEKGVKVARRTVNKYRTRIKQLSSRQRRSA
ncbi:MAG TPA: RNA polymerase factor sigma-54 [Fimbriimonadaceae bacterium]|nr:RNA polymerase factor sigma-54 [Fimbriimonadaceae bacterium]